MYFRVLAMGLLMAGGNIAQAATVQEVFNGNMLGKSQAHFETIAGAPQESYGDDRVFDVQGCLVTATIKSGKVSALSLEPSETCKPDLASFIGEYAPKPGQKITPAAFGSDLTYTADCLTDCGNAADPWVYASWTAPSVAGGMEIMLGFVQAGDQALDAAEKWATQMEKAEGKDYLLNNKFNCDARYNSVADAAFKNVIATSVKVGFDLPKESCR
ncbi:hypothetical protein [Achromobacter aegrifaciens]|uniref:hypothetical protein n=1 Tax=Achromobacter aegrifaciens TaxID=1287736 RepID=UPI001583ABAC|nr:hypothetical protein [Achromobacter aegrifaciens]